MCSVTGRATYAIDKKLMAGQRAVSAFGGMKTSEARAKGLTGLTRNFSNAKAKKDSPKKEEQSFGLNSADMYEDVNVKPGPIMQQFWGPPPSQEQYDEARKSAAGAGGWQERFEQDWVDKSEALVKQAEANRIKDRGKQASRGSSLRNRMRKVRVATLV